MLLTYYSVAVSSLEIGAPSVALRDGLVRWSVPVTGLDDVPAELWFTVETQFADLLTDRADPALVAITLAMMFRGTDIRVSGPVTDELVYSLQGAYEQIASVTNGVPTVGIAAANLLPPVPHASGVAAGFSGGVDSFACFADHLLNPDVPPSLRLTHLLMNNVGAYGHARAGRAVWRQKCDALSEYLRDFHIPLVAVDSNVDDFYPETLHFQQSHTVRNAAVAHLLAGGIGLWFYGSGYTVWYSHANSGYASAHSDPFTLPVLSTSNLTLAQHGQTLTRVNKTRRIADIPAAHKHLDVCIDPLDRPGCNCSKCVKCLRTQVTLDMLGVLDEFGAVFDLQRYREYRDEYLARTLLRPNNPFSIEIRDLLYATQGHSRARRALIIARGQSMKLARFLKSS